MVATFEQACQATPSRGGPLQHLDQVAEFARIEEQGRVADDLGHVGLALHRIGLPNSRACSSTASAPFEGGNSTARTLQESRLLGHGLRLHEDKPFSKPMSAVAAARPSSSSRPLRRKHLQLRIRMADQVLPEGREQKLVIVGGIEIRRIKEVLPLP